MKGRKLKQKKIKRRNKRNNYIKINILTDAIDMTLGTDRSINIYNTLKVLPQFQQMKGVFQQFSLRKVTVKAFPRRSLQGDLNRDYGITRITMLTNPNSNIDADTNKLGRTVCPVIKPETVTFTTSGRQNDFHYWFDTDNSDVGPSCSVLVGNLRDDSSNTYNITLQLGFTVEFRYPCVHSQTGKEDRVEYKYIPKGDRDKEEKKQEP